MTELPSAKPTTSRPFASDAFGTSLSLSADGKTLAVGAPLDSGDSSDTGTPTNTASTEAGAVYLFAADGSDVWRRRAFLKSRTAPPFDLLGSDVALSGDGKVLAAKACGFAANAEGLRRNHRAGAMIGRQEGDASCFWGGSSYVFEESPDGVWAHAAAAIPAPGELVSFEFFSLARSANAQTLGLGTTSYRNGAAHSSVRIY